jgi:hypothetical protein
VDSGTKISGTKIMSIQIEAERLAEKHKKALILELDELLGKYRKYPDGFIFYFRGKDDEPEECKILNAYVDFQPNKNILFDYSGFAIWYRCHSPYWCTEEGTHYPMTEQLIDRAIEKYGLHSPTTAKA